MLIHYKGLVPDRFEDAPFVGTLWIAPDCKRHCPGCFNQHLLDSPTIVEDSSEIIRKVREDKFSEGIIFAGLDPFTYPNELVHLVGKSLEAGLKVMIYTALSNEDELIDVIPELLWHKRKGIYIKYGSYQEDKRVYDYTSHGVLLATSNQYIEIF